MAKITTIKYQINGVNYSTNVNCGVDGYFSATLPEEVAAAFNINKSLSYSTLDLLQKSFDEEIKKYKNRVTNQELFILLRYGSSGRFADKEDGSSLFYDKYGVSLSMTNSQSDILLFDFKVCIKENIDGNINWFETQLGHDFPFWEKEKTSIPDKYFKHGKCYDENKYKKIPFTIAALNTLKTAQEKIRILSEGLFNFIEQDEEQILLTLTNQKLLN